MQTASHGLPQRLWVVRHGQSTSNVAAAQAERTGAQRLELTCRDMDVPLSDAGREQAAALGRWLGHGEVGPPPDRVLASPYLRARQTAGIALEVAGWSAELRPGLDERLRDREMGSFEGLTWSGLQAELPALAAQRERLGKFYQRPPGGEAWTDVLLRLRSFDQTLQQGVGERVMVFAHDIVVLLLCYLYEELDEHAVLALGENQPIANASITTFVREGPRLRLESYSQVAPLEDTAAPVTTQEDDHAAVE